MKDRPAMKLPSDYVDDYHRRLKELIKNEGDPNQLTKLLKLSKEIDQVLLDNSAQVVRDFKNYTVLYKTAVLCAAMTKDADPDSSIASTIATIHYLMKHEIDKAFEGMDEITDELFDHEYVDFVKTHLPTNVVDIETWKKSRRKKH